MTVRNALRSCGRSRPASPAPSWDSPPASPPTSSVPPGTRPLARTAPPPPAHGSMVPNLCQTSGGTRRATPRHSFTGQTRCPHPPSRVRPPRRRPPAARAHPLPRTSRCGTAAVPGTDRLVRRRYRRAVADRSRRPAPEARSPPMTQPQPPTRHRGTDTSGPSSSAILRLASRCW